MKWIATFGIEQSEDGRWAICYFPYSSEWLVEDKTQRFGSGKRWTEEGKGFATAKEAKAWAERKAE